MVCEPTAKVDVAMVGWWTTDGTIMLEWRLGDGKGAKEWLDYSIVVTWRKGVSLMVGGGGLGLVATAR